MFDAYAAIERIKRNLAEFILDWKRVRDEDVRKSILSMWSETDPKKGSLISKILIENNFPYEQSDKKLSELLPDQLGELIKQIDLTANIAETGRLPQKRGGGEYFNGNKSLQRAFVDLIRDNVFSTDFYLYEHQRKTIEYSLKENKNIILSSGTGSGKTEAFLIPTLARLFQESDGERIQPGIRVIILYPMNALINNQIKRLQVWLGAQDPDSVPIRFGLYNSKLEEDKNRKRVYQNNTSVYATWPDYQVLDRNELRNNPPHILVTNYSMLEYALIRPADMPLFSPSRRKLHTIILDEAHTYIGAMAAEITMLLRRTLTAFEKTSSDIHFFATSATIGDPEQDDGEALRKFCGDIFTVPNDTVKVVLGNRKMPQQLVHSKSEMSLEGLLSLVKAIDCDEEQSQKVLSPYIKIFDTDDTYRIIYEYASRVPQVKQLVESLLLKPLIVEDIAHVFGLSGSVEDIDSTKLLLKYLSAAVSRAGKSLLPIRAHIVCNAPRGVYQCSSCGKLNPHGDHCMFCGHEELFEIVICKKCGNSYLASGEDRNVLPDWRSNKKILLYDKKTYESIPNDICAICENRSKHISEESSEESIAVDNGVEDEYTHIFKDYFFEPILVSNTLVQQTILDSMYESLDSEQQTTEKMTGGGRKLLSFTDNRQKAARLAARIEWTHDNLLGRRIILNALERLVSHDDTSYSSFDTFLCENEWGKFIEKRKEFIDKVKQEFNGLLTLSADKREEELTKILSAYEDGFIPDLFSEEEFLQLTLSYLAQQQSQKQLVTFQDLQQEIANREDITELTSFYEKSDSASDIAYCLLAREFVLLRRRNKLESVGLCAVRFPKSDMLKGRINDNPYLSKYPSHVILNIAEVILHRLRLNGRVVMPQSDSMSKKSKDLFDYSVKRDYFLEGNFSLNNEKNDGKGVNLLPRKDNSNAFTDIVQKNIGDCSLEESRTVLAELWACMESVYSSAKVFISSNPNDHEPTYSINLEKLLFEYKPKVYKCVKCNAIFPYHKNMKCFDRYCDGSVREISHTELAHKVYGYKRVENYPLIGMKTIEHTAQIDLNELSENESKFVHGEVNFLSSSTTMELGIDIGGLTTVFMANCPPGPSNYLQRAGRAGRRSDKTSLVVTNARKVPLDQYFFYHPNLFFARKPHTPYISLGSRKIISHHLNSYILSEYFKYKRGDKEFPENNPLKSFGNVKGFFIGEDYQEPFDEFYAWLTSETKRDAHSLEYIIRGTELEDVSIRSYCEDFAWELYTLNDKIHQYNRDIEAAIVGADYSGKDRYKKLLEIQKKRFMEENLIKFLIERQILPKYGFPIDVVSLNTRNRDNFREKNPPRLGRQLSVAISEYAPGHSIVVNKRNITSKGISTNFEWGGESFTQGSKKISDVITYVICKNCNHFFTIDSYRDDRTCPVCSHKEDKQLLSDYPFDDEPSRQKKTKGNSFRIAYLPKGFSVDFMEKQPYYTTASEGVKTHSTIHPSLDFETVTPILRNSILTSTYEDGMFYSINEGKGFGYAVCLYCGRCEVEDGYDKELSGPMRKHNQLRREDQKCIGPRNSAIQRNKMFAARFSTDAIRIRLQGRLNPELYNIQSADLEVFYRSLARTMLIASAKILGIDERELSYTLIPVKISERFTNHSDMVLYDNVPGGAGYSQLIEELMFTREFYKEMENIVTCTENCKTACPACILDFENYESEKDKYNRHFVLQMLQDRNVQHLIETSTTKDGEIDDSEIVIRPKQEILRQLKKEKITHIQIVIGSCKDFGYIFEDRLYNRLMELVTANIPVDILFSIDEDRIFENEIYRYKLLLLQKCAQKNLRAMTLNTQTDVVVRIFETGSMITYSRLMQEQENDTGSISSQDPLLKRVDENPSSKDLLNGEILDVIPLKKVSVIEVNERTPVAVNPWSLVCNTFSLSADMDIKKIYYTDRYLTTKRQIVTFFKLISFMRLSDQTRLYLASLPIQRDKKFDSFKSNSDRQKFCEKLSKQLSIQECTVFTAQTREDIPGSQHQREMLLVTEDDSRIRLVFEKGMDLLKFKAENHDDIQIGSLVIDRYNKNLIVLLDDEKEREQRLDIRIWETVQKKKLNTVPHD